MNPEAELFGGGSKPAGIQFPKQSRCSECLGSDVESETGQCSPHRKARWDPDHFQHGGASAGNISAQLAQGISPGPDFESVRSSAR